MQRKFRSLRYRKIKNFTYVKSKRLPRDMFLASIQANIS